MTAYDMMPCTDRNHVSYNNCRIAHRRLALEARIVQGMIRALKREGWLPTRVNDGGDELLTVKNEKEAMDALFAVDEAAIGFSKGDAHHSVYCVLGNGVDVICDWNYSRGDVDGFNAAMGRITDRLMEKYDN